MALGKWVAVTPFVFLIISSCASESCRSLASKERQAQTATKGTVQIYKYDGSKQCKMGQKVTLKKMSEELSGIPVVSMKNISDGKIRTAVCGAETGLANVYEISSNDKKKALELGFKIWNFKSAK